MVSGFTSQAIFQWFSYTKIPRFKSAHRDQHSDRFFMVVNHPNLKFFSSDLMRSQAITHHHVISFRNKSQQHTVVINHSHLSGYVVQIDESKRDSWMSLFLFPWRLPSASLLLSFYFSRIHTYHQRWRYLNECWVWCTFALDLLP